MYSIVANYEVKGMILPQLFLEVQGMQVCQIFLDCFLNITPLGGDNTSALENLASEAVTKAEKMTVAYNAAIFQVALNCAYNFFVWYV